MTYLTDPQREAVGILNDYILDPAELWRRCPLGYSRHRFKIKKAAMNLGSLKRLPPELHYEIMGHLDVLSLITFRRVSKMAMTIVNTMVEYKKVRDR